MARRTRLGQLLAAASFLLSTASSLPTEAQPQPLQERQVTAHGAPSPWVTVDASGRATTITPTVTSSGGSATTISPPPAELTQTGTYTLSPTNAAVTTSTGLSPVATASSDTGEGVFLACSVYKSVDAPFCQPKAGSQLNPGQTYYITWSDSYFSNTSTSIQIQGTYHDGSSEGFTSSRMVASKGFYIWSIPSDFFSATLDNPSLTSVNVSLSLAYFQDLYGLDVETVPGPTVIVTSNKISDPQTGGGGKKNNTVAIAVPVVVVVVFLVLAGLCVWSWRRHGTVPVLGALKRRSTGGGQGYGIRQSAAQRTGGGAAAPPVVGGGGDHKPAVGVELTDRDSWSPGTSPRSGGNVFREEMERQQRER